MQSLIFKQLSRSLIAALLLILMPLSLAGGPCGNGLIDLDLNIPEQCDDGNNEEGDGCSRLCQVENGWECTAPYLALGEPNLVKDPGFEQGDGNTPWINASSIEPVICSVETCQEDIGSRQGAWWGQIGGVSNQTWLLGQELQDTNFNNEQYWLKFSVMNADCTNESPDVFGVFLDDQRVWLTDGVDPACPQQGSTEMNKYREVLVDISAQFPVGTIPTQLTMGTNSGSSNFIIALDEFHVGPAAAPPVPSVCTLETNVRAYEDFEGISGGLDLPDFQQFVLGEFGIKWGTTDDGMCGTFQNPPGNHTGEPGQAACIDSSQFFQRQQAGGQLFIETYFCQAPIDLSFFTGSSLQLTVNYQPGSVTNQDFFGVWVDTQPFMGPLSAGTGNAVFITNNPQGQFGEAPGIPYTFDVSRVDLKEEVYVCIGYGNDGAGYAQVDTVILRNDDCTDDFEEDKLGSCVDNCVLVPNTDQTDSDNDGYGNACDADIARNIGAPDAIANGNNCVVNFQDLIVIADAFFSKPTDTEWNPDADFNGDGVINFLDLSIFSGQFLEEPGPSGITGVCGVGGGT